MAPMDVNVGLKTAARIAGVSAPLLRKWIIEGRITPQAHGRKRGASGYEHVFNWPDIVAIAAAKGARSVGANKAIITNIFRVLTIQSVAELQDWKDAGHVLAISDDEFCLIKRDGVEVIDRAMRGKNLACLMLHIDRCWNECERRLKKQKEKKQVRTTVRV